MKIVIIGNGVAGVTAAETIRSADKTCEITMLSSEQHAFYSRPRLIEFLADAVTMEQITIHARGWYAKNAIELIDSVTVVGVDTKDKVIADKNGKKIFV